MLLQTNSTTQKMKFSIKDFFSKRDQIRSSADLVTFTEEILNGKRRFLCSAPSKKFDRVLNRSLKDATDGRCLQVTL